ncbi:MAG: hypothetical protein KAS38_04375 [Anaerolineales bacterium]|nr:hypothetical protein [Anaerolineales bacterium]
MNIKKYLLAALAGGVGTSVAYVILFFPLNSYLERNILVPAGASSQGSTVSSTVATISMALIMAYIYPKGYEGGSPVSEGLRFGILIGLLYGIPLTLHFGSLFPISFGALLLWALIETLKTAAGGLAIGLVYGRMEQTKE